MAASEFGRFGEEVDQAGAVQPIGIFSTALNWSRPSSSDLIPATLIVSLLRRRVLTSC
jgi:hypothetical protein